jgi:hypothetical protein
MAWKPIANSSSTSRPRLDAKEERVRSVRRLAIVLTGALALALIVYLVAQEETWDWLADLARNDRWRPATIAIVAGVCLFLWPLSARFRKNIPRGVAVAAGVATILGLVFALLPNLKPATVSSYEFKNFAIEHDVSLSDYMQRYPVKHLLGEGPWQFPSLGDPRLSSRGAVVLFDSEVKGHSDEAIGLQWTLFDAKTKRRLATSGGPNGIDPLCEFHQPSVPADECLQRTPRLQDADVAGFELWIDTSKFPDADCFFIRLEADSGGGRMTSADSVPFTSESKPDPSCEKGSSTGA